MNEEKKKEKIKKVFTEDLPVWGKGEGNGKIGTTNWKKCVGCKVRFIYDDIEGWIEIVDYKDNNLYCRKSELEYIKNNIFESKLNEIFDLSKIKWDECEEFALSNRVKEACD